MRKVCVVTGTRAEYGLLRPLLEEIRDDARLELQLAVTGAHLVPEFGDTVAQIEADGFEPSVRIDMLLASNTTVGVSKSLGLAVMGFADAYERLRPDLVVLLGDRYEILAAAQAAMIARIPLGHIHGGETSEGAIDEAMRHAITKMSHLHFVAAEPYRRRVIQLGEQPNRVWTVGALGLDHVRRLRLLTRTELGRQIGFDCTRPFALATFHPATLEAESPVAQLDHLFRALDESDLRVLFTKANADVGGTRINAALERYAAERPDRVGLVASLGQLRYLSAMRHAEIVLGNSSSGIIEAPAVGTPTVNVGSRQQGRLRSPSIIDCAPTVAAITRAIRRARSAAFGARAAKRRSPFGDGRAARRIARVLRSVPLDRLLVKTFHDLRRP